ncbi:MAG TPA: response regulator transcription factor [Gaiellales bacterium]|jgi:DNA-binding response OmpR family regulator|nr:response regulator transcription factor [Gaiellales bacterium]HSS54078.1 response regulator transcription factor [Gaiellales bacterium]HWG83142.1 response regulator transcription factor [Gaiellales bacterium]HZI35950.1 response regulator transcription factor [Gaiellales bacterium]
MRVLVVEDDQPLVRIMTKSLESNGFEVTSAFDGEDGLRAARDDRPDAIVLDLQLPRLNGVDLCRRLRSEGNAVPILMLTARSTVPDRIGGLDAGADDYLVKPFSLGELAARLRALGRRGKTTPQVIEAGPLQLDTGAREARVNGSPVELTGTEFALLEYLMQNAGQVLSRDQLREEVWGEGFEPASNVVDIYVHYVRRKLKAAGLEADPIRTVRGLGYAFRRGD